MMNSVIEATILAIILGALFSRVAWTRSRNAKMIARLDRVASYDGMVRRDERRIRYGQVSSAVGRVSGAHVFLCVVPGGTLRGPVAFAIIESPHLQSVIFRRRVDGIFGLGQSTTTGLYTAHDPTHRLAAKVFSTYEHTRAVSGVTRRPDLMRYHASTGKLSAPTGDPDFDALIEVFADPVEVCARFGAAARSALQEAVSEQHMARMFRGTVVIDLRRAGWVSGGSNDLEDSDVVAQLRRPIVAVAAALDELARFSGPFNRRRLQKVATSDPDPRVRARVIDVLHETYGDKGQLRRWIDGQARATTDPGLRIHLTRYLGARAAGELLWELIDPPHGDDVPVASRICALDAASERGVMRDLQALIPWLVGALKEDPQLIETALHTLTHHAGVEAVPHLMTLLDGGARDRPALSRAQTKALRGVIHQIQAREGSDPGALAIAVAPDEGMLALDAPPHDAP